MLVPDALCFAIIVLPGWMVLVAAPAGHLLHLPLSPFFRPIRLSRPFGEEKPKSGFQNGALGIESERLYRSGPVPERRWILQRSSGTIAKVSGNPTSHLANNWRRIGPKKSQSHHHPEFHGHLYLSDRLCALTRKTSRAIRPRSYS